MNISEYITKTKQFQLSNESNPLLHSFPSMYIAIFSRKLRSLSSQTNLKLLESVTWSVIFSLFTASLQVFLQGSHWFLAIFIFFYLAENII